MKVAVIGCGYWGKNLIRNFAELGVLAAVCDHDNSAASRMAEKYGVEAVTYESVLAGDYEGVVVATPAAQHYEMTSALLRSGKHVFVEKPIALEKDEAVELCALAEKQNKKLMVGHLLQYHPAFIKLKNMVMRGEIGKLQYIYSNRLNLGKFRDEENILLSFAPHDISMILSIAGSLPETVYATGVCHLNQHIHDVTTMHMEFKKGLSAHIFVSWLHPYKEQKLVVVGDQGMLVFDDTLDWNEKLQYYPHGVNWIEGVPHPKKAESIPVELEISEPLKNECQHFIDSVKMNTQPRTDSLEGLRVLQVLDSGQKSLATGKKYNLDKNFISYYTHETAVVDKNVSIGAKTKIWHFSHILGNCTLGANCTIGQNVMIGPDVVIGNDCKIQNNVSLYKGVTLSDGVFCGPSCVFTNVKNPRATIERKDAFANTFVGKNATIGANATIVCGNQIGEYALVAAGAVVTKNVRAHALVVGNPARQVGWVSHAGEVLDENMTCKREGRRYRISVENTLEEVKKSNEPVSVA